MRSRNDLERLAVAGRPLLIQADSLVDGVEQDRILERIFASDRSARAVHRYGRAALVLAGVAVFAAAGAAAALEIGHGNGPVTAPNGHHEVALSGARIELAGYRFRTPAGFKASTSSCAPASNETPVRNGFAAAASAAGGCVEAAFLIGESQVLGGAIPAAAEPVDVGSYRGHYAAGAPEADASTLYVELPNATGDQRFAYLVLIAHGLTEDQLVAVAESGLPTVPLRPTTTTGTESSG
jgi:hypothetical protein